MAKADVQTLNKKYKFDLSETIIFLRMVQDTNAMDKLLLYKLRLLV